MAILRFNIIYDRKHATKSGKQGYVEVRFCMNRQQKYFLQALRCLQTNGIIRNVRLFAIPTEWN